MYHGSWSQTSFFHSFATSGNITYFPVFLLISFSWIKGMSAGSSVCYHVQLPQNKRQGDLTVNGWNLRGIPSTAQKPFLNAYSMHMHTTGNSCRFAGRCLDSPVKTVLGFGNLFIVLIQELETAPQTALKTVSQIHSWMHAVLQILNDCTSSLNR